jgi:hypothetical protein
VIFDAPDGHYVLALGGYGNRKTELNETTEVLIDDVLLTVDH